MNVYWAWTIDTTPGGSPERIGAGGRVVATREPADDAPLAATHVPSQLVGQPRGPHGVERLQPSTDPGQCHRPVPGLTREQKLQILNNWQLDASRLVESEGEGMGGGGAAMLHRVRVALAEVMGQDPA